MHKFSIFYFYLVVISMSVTTMIISSSQYTTHKNNLYTLIIMLCKLLSGVLWYIDGE